MTTGAFVVVTIFAQPPDTRRHVEFAEGSLIAKIVERGNSYLLYSICLSAGDGMWTIDEAVERTVANCGL
jgi:hypothetical protein